jgi:hypothetical protein
MYPAQFAEHLAVWLAEAQHPGIAQVRTCAAIGRHEQPVGVAVTLSDGWLWIAQCVGGSPPGGDEKRATTSQRPDLPEGPWEEMPAYRQARKQFEAEQAAYDGPRPRIHQASVASLLDLVVDVIQRAGHPDITAIDRRHERPVVVVTFGDGATVYCRHAGFIAAGTTELVET